MDASSRSSLLDWRAADPPASDRRYRKPLRQAPDGCASRQRIGRQTQAKFAVVLVSGIAHHLMKTRRIQIAQQPPHDVRVMQTGVAGEVIARGRRFDGDVRCMQADRTYVSNGGSIGKAA